MEPNDLRELQEPMTALKQKFIFLTEEYRPALWQYCHRLTGSAFDAEDLVQDTLLRAFAKLGYLGQALNPKAYLFRMASNLWINQNKKRMPIQIETQMDFADEPNEQQEDITDLMEWLINILPQKQRVVFLLSSSFDFTNKEIAEMIGTSEGTIKSYLHRARRTLAADLKKKEKTGKTTHIAKEPVTNDLVKRYINAFNDLNATEILSLLDDQATTTITGDWIELGKEQSEKFSLYYWQLDPVEKWLEFGYVDGIPALFGMRKNADGKVCLREVIRLRHDEEKIYEVQWHFFTIDLIRYVAKKLGIPAMVEGYQYNEKSVINVT